MIFEIDDRMGSKEQTSRFAGTDKYVIPRHRSENIPQSIYLIGAPKVTSLDLKSA